MASKQCIEKASQRDRLRSGVEFLLNCFDPMHHLKMAKIVCFVLKDVGTYLLEMDFASRIEAFSTLPSIVMDDLGFLEKRESSKLDTAVVSQEDLLLLFVVCYLSLNGKSHLDKIVEKMKISSPPTVSRFLALDSKTVRQDCLKYPEFFHLDDEECLQLDAAFFLPIKGSSKGVDSSIKTEGFPQRADITDSPQCQGSSKGAASSKTERFLQSANRAHSSQAGGQESSKGVASSKEGFIHSANSTNSPQCQGSSKGAACSKTERSLQSENRAHSSQSGGQESSKGVASSKTGFIQSANSSNLPQSDCTRNLASEALNIMKTGVEKSYCSNFESDKNATSAPKIEVEINKKSKKNILKKSSSPEKRKGRKSSRDGKANVASKDVDSNEEKRIVVRDKGLKEIAITTENHGINVNTTLQDTICVTVREGIMFLYERFKCQIDMYLVFVVLHVLQEVKNLFLSLTRSEQITLVKNIICPLWIAAVEDNSGTYLRPSLEASELNKGHMDLLLISYAVSQSENLHISTLLEIFKKHRIDATELKQKNEYFNRGLFSLDKSDCIKFANFPPEKWMAERLFLENNAASKQDINIHEIIMKRMFTKNLSRLPPNWRDNLVILVQESIAYLLQFFEFNLYSGLFEIVMNTAKDCVLFFDQSIAQQKQLIFSIFCAFIIDARGRVLSNNLAMFRPIENKWKILLSMLYLINVRRFAHYRELFDTYHARIGKSKYLTDHKQKNYFKSRTQNFCISSDGYVCLVNVLTIKFNYISMLLSERSQNPILFNPGLPIPRAVNVRSYFRPPFSNSNAFIPRMNYNPITLNTNSFTPIMNLQPQVFNPMVIMPAIESRILNNNIHCGDNAQNAASVSENKAVLKNETSEISNSFIHNRISSPLQQAREETAGSVITDKVWKRVKDGIFYLSQHFTFDADDFCFIFCVLEDVDIYVRKLSLEARRIFVEECVDYYFSCSDSSSEHSILDDEEKVALFIAFLLKRRKKLHFTQIFEIFLQSTPDDDLPCSRRISALLEFDKKEKVETSRTNFFLKKWKRVFFVSPDGTVQLLPSLVRNIQFPSGSSSNETENENRNTTVEYDRNCGIFNIGSSETNFSEKRNNNCQVGKTENASRCAEVGDNNASSGNIAPVFNLLEVLNNDESSVVSATNSNKDHCDKESITELRTKNFFVVVLGQSKDGLNVQVLREKLRLASSEVQHYMACVYKDNILNFLQNQDEFYISPTTGNVCYKAKNKKHSC